MSEKNGRACYYCKRPARPPKELTFFVGEFKLQVHKGEAACGACKEKEYRDNFEEYRNDLVWLKDGELIVNWQRFAQNGYERKGLYSHELGCQEVELDVMYVYYVLMPLGILSQSPVNGFMIDALGNNFNPSVSIFDRLYFMREKDVIEYARLMYKCLQYDWDIRQVSRVIPRKEVLKPQAAMLPHA